MEHGYNDVLGVYIHFLMGNRWIIGQNNGLRVYTTIMGREWLKIMGVLMGYIQY